MGYDSRIIVNMVNMGGGGGGGTETTYSLRRRRRKHLGKNKTTETHINTKTFLQHRRQHSLIGFGIH